MHEAEHEDALMSPGQVRDFHLEENIGRGGADGGLEQGRPVVIPHRRVSTEKSASCGARPNTSTHPLCASAPHAGSPLSFCVTSSPSRFRFNMGDRDDEDRNGSREEVRLPRRPLESLTTQPPASPHAIPGPVTS